MKIILLALIFIIGISAESVVEVDGIKIPKYKQDMPTLSSQLANDVDMKDKSLYLEDDGILSPQLKDELDLQQPIGKTTLDTNIIYSRVNSDETSAQPTHLDDAADLNMTDESILSPQLKDEVDLQQPVGKTTLDTNIIYSRVNSDETSAQPTHLDDATDLNIALTNLNHLTDVNLNSTGSGNSTPKHYLN